MVMLFVIPLCWIKHLRHLAYLSILMLLGMLLAYLTIIFYSASRIGAGEHRYEEVKMFDALNYPFFVGIAMLNFEGNPTSLNVRNSMKQPSRFINAFMLSGVFVCTLTMIGKF